MGRRTPLAYAPVLARGTSSEPTCTSNGVCGTLEATMELVLDYSTSPSCRRALQRRGAAGVLRESLSSRASDRVGEPDAAPAAARVRLVTGAYWDHECGGTPARRTPRCSRRRRTTTKFGGSRADEGRPDLRPAIASQTCVRGERGGGNRAAAGGTRSRAACCAAWADELAPHWPSGNARAHLRPGATCRRMAELVRRLSRTRQRVRPASARGVPVDELLAAP